MQQTILGANGIIATEIAKALPQYNTQIKLVSRHPEKVNDTDLLQSADLLDAAQTDAAVKGSDIVYLTAGLPYKAKLWQQQWPLLMQNVIAACRNHNAKLVFFDNIYMYGAPEGVMTETHPFNATSGKGLARAQAARMLLEAVEKNGLTALIARAPEFYGPRNTISGVNSLVFDNIRKGKKAQWLVSDSRKRTFIYTPDAGRATALLANRQNTWNQSWHLPCAALHPTGKEFMTWVSEAAGRNIPYGVMPKWMVRLGGLFNPYAKEVVELLYQYDQDYIFSSDKFKTAFPNFEITPYKEGIGEVMKEIFSSTK
jgi:nucleoside-diphosphate-sugar epimerase